jgi:hypothetical protein
LLELWLADRMPEPEIDVAGVIEGFVVSHPVGEPNGEIYDLHETPSGAASVAENGQNRLHLSLKDHTVANRPIPRKD